MDPEVDVKSSARDAHPQEETHALNVCPHCWHVNMYAPKLCGRCGADMSTVLQESGGMRWAAPMQSPAPHPAGRRLPLLLRVVLFVLVVILALARLVAPLVAPMARGQAAHTPMPVERQ